MSQLIGHERFWRDRHAQSGASNQPDTADDAREHGASQAEGDDLSAQFHDQNRTDRPTVQDKSGVFRLAPQENAVSSCTSLLSK